MTPRWWEDKEKMRETLAEHRRRRRERSFVGRVSFGVALLAAAATAAIEGSGNGIHLNDVFAMALLAVGAGMLVGTVFGHGRRLIPLTIFLSFLTVVSSYTTVPISGAMGQRTAQPLSIYDLADNYQVFAGHLSLDLTAFQAPANSTTPIKVKAEVGAGWLQVLLPDNAGYTMTAELGAGRFDVFGHGQGGSSIRHTYTHAAKPGAPTFDIETNVGFGRLEVDSTAAISGPVEYLPVPPPPTSTTSAPNPTTPSTEVTK